MSRRLSIVPMNGRVFPSAKGLHRVRRRIVAVRRHGRHGVVAARDIRRARGVGRLGAGVARFRFGLLGLCFRRHGSSSAGAEILRRALR